MSVEAVKKYAYAVSAVQKIGNKKGKKEMESERTPPIEVTIPDP